MKTFQSIVLFLSLFLNLRCSDDAPKEKELFGLWTLENSKDLRSEKLPGPKFIDLTGASFDQLLIVERDPGEEMRLLVMDPKKKSAETPSTSVEVAFPAMTLRGTAKRGILFMEESENTKLEMTYSNEAGRLSICGNSIFLSQCLIYQ